MATIKHCFAGGNTSIGFYSLFNKLAPDLERLYIIFGSTSSLKSEMITKIGELLNQKEFNVEYLHSLIDYQAIEGVIIPDLQLGIIDGNSVHPLAPQYPGARDYYINLGDLWIEERIIDSKDQMIQLTNLIQNKLEQFHRELSLAKKIHEQKEKIYISAMDFGEANRVTKQLISDIFALPIKPYSNMKERHFFLGASTADGAVNFIENITLETNKRYIIKGRSGSGKSTMMRKVANRAKDLGLGVEYYHCSFDPISLDMIIIPALSIAILDGTSPHVIDPSRPTDQVIDMFTLCIDPQVEVQQAEQIHKLNTNYRFHIQTGTALLKEVKEINDQLDTIYRNGIDLKAHQEEENKWITEIMQYSQHRNE